ncbi:VirD4-like conjugal transfer protein, CD1115 family [Paenibacillus alvei]|uniref:VirD4-like conjugal transfer protein, CD1115 family n=1 Tax=Paenibacillus alvei TaxID=44250 RepID=UPI00227E819F|nr:type IV secretory system conjugative DNA transfer family protein [Paenibacillus alvei]
MERFFIWMRWLSSIFLAIVSTILLPLITGVFRSLYEKKITFMQVKEHIWQFLFKTKHYGTFFEWNPVNAAAWGLLLYIYWICVRHVISGKVEKKETYEDRSDYGSHGSSRWQTEEEITKHYYSGKPGFIIGDIKEREYRPDGKYAVIPNDGTTNLNIIAIGPPGSEKTTGLVMPNIVHTAKNLGYSMVITDPKGELYAETADLCEKEGYDVQVLDFLNLLRGNRINYLENICDDTDLLKIADSYVMGGNVAKGSKGSSDPIWDDGEKALLGALIGFVKHVYVKQPEKQTLTMVSKILNSEFQDPEKYPSLFKRYGVTGTAEHLFNNFLLAKDKTRDGILFGLATKLTLFAIPGVQNLTSRSDFDIKDIGRRKVALYVMVSDADRIYSPLVTVFWSILFSSIYNLRLTEPDAKTPILCAMDELANIGRIAGLQEKLGTMRSRQLYPLMIWQGLPQFKDRYPDKSWEDVYTMCDTRLLLAANDNDTQSYFSEQLGKTTVQVQGTSQNIKREDLVHNGEGATSSYTGRPLLFPDEIGRMAGDEIIMLQKGKLPVRLKKLQYRYWEESMRVCDLKPYNQIPLIPKWDSVVDIGSNSFKQPEIDANDLSEDMSKVLNIKF